MSDTAFTEYKVKVVSSINALHDSGVLIDTTGGSTNMSGSGEYEYTISVYGQSLEGRWSDD